MIKNLLYYDVNGYRQHILTFPDQFWQIKVLMLTHQNERIFVSALILIWPEATTKGEF